MCGGVLFVVLGITALLSIDSSSKTRSLTLFRTRRLVALEVRICIPHFSLIYRLMPVLTACAYSREYGGHLEFCEQSSTKEGVTLPQPSSRLGHIWYELTPCILHTYRQTLLICLHLQSYLP